MCRSCSDREKKVRGYRSTPQRVCDECFDKPQNPTLADACRELQRGVWAAFETARPALHKMGCVDSAEERDKKKRRRALCDGAKFVRSAGSGRIAAKLTFGKLGTAPVFLRLDADNDRLVVSALSGGGASNKKEKDMETFPLSTIGSAGMGKGSTKFTLLTEGDAVLLELEAPSKTVAQDFVLGINEAVRAFASESEQLRPSDAESKRAERMAHLHARQAEVADRKRQADAKKSKYMKVGATEGLKYTAIAMANR